MYSDAGYGLPNKPLPPPAAHEKLPPLPPRDEDTDFDRLPPIPHKASVASLRLKPSRSHLDLSSSPNREPGTSQYAEAPQSPSGDPKKNTNPLADLIETEKEYVDRLAGIIRKVAGAWSRNNLPPQDLDTMFRSIEGIYKANRSLLSKLKDVGANPSSPKALGDLLMRWVDDLEKPYTPYCTKYVAGFDSWEPVQSNDRLRTVLAMFSASTPPPLPPSSPLHPSEPPLWTLDKLFLLPKDRLVYYRRLYSRLLKGTSPGRSDNRLLTSAMEKLERLLTTLDPRLSIDIHSVTTYTSPPPPEETEDEVALDLRGRQSLAPHSAPLVFEAPPPLPNMNDAVRPESADAAQGLTPPPAAPLTVPALEQRLSAERTMDIFTMQPRKTRLQLSPPSLHYTREVRFSTDVVVRFIPRATGQEVIHELGHVFILTDLFVLCERMKPRERAQFGPEGPDMWLVYPPLAGKHLRVAPVPNSETSLAVIILKETLTLQTSTPALRDRLYSEFAECIDAAAILSSSAAKSPPQSGQPVLPGDASGPPSGPTSPIRSSPGPPLQGSSRPPSASAERYSGSMSPSSVRSPSSGQAPSLPGNSPSRPQFRSSSSSGDVPLLENMARLALGDPPAQRPPEHQQQQPSAYPSRSTSVSSRRSNDAQAPGQLSRQPSFNIGQVVPSQQFAGSQPPMPSFRPGQNMPPQGSPMQPGYQGPAHAFGPGQAMPQMGARPGMPPAGYGPGRDMPPGGPPYQPGQPMPPGPGQGMPPYPGRGMPPGPGMSMHPGQGMGGSPGQGMGGPPGPGMGRPPGPGMGVPPRQGMGGPPGPGMGGAPGQGNGMWGIPPPGRDGMGSQGPGAFPQRGPSLRSVSNDPPHRNPMSGGMPPGSGPQSPFAQPQYRAPSDPSFQGGVRRSTSSRSLRPHDEMLSTASAPPMPAYPGGLPPPNRLFGQRNNSTSSLHSLPSQLHGPPEPTLLPSEQLKLAKARAQQYDDLSPPASPVNETPQQALGPTSTSVTANMKCKVFLQQQHAQWKPLGTAHLKLYRESPTNVKQLVVEADDKKHSVLISTIVLADGVERVGKTGVAVELSDRGRRSGIVYMLQLRNEKSAGGLFDSLIAGSDRSAGAGVGPAP